MPRRSNRNKANAAKYEPKPLLQTYMNHVGKSITFNSQLDFMKEVPPRFRSLHNQKNQPFCAFYSIVTAVEIAQNRKFTVEENTDRHGFCLNTGRQGGMRLENSLDMYVNLYPTDLTYQTAFNENSSKQYSSKNGVGKDYGNANDLINGLKQGVCLTTISCADVDSQYRLHERKKCRANDYHAITCVAFILLKKKPTFVFKDTNNRPKNKYNFVFLDADEFTDGQLMLEKAIGGIWHRVADATAETRKKIYKENLLVMEEIYIVNALKRADDPVVKQTGVSMTPSLLMNQLSLKSVYNINGLSEEQKAKAKAKKSRDKKDIKKIKF